MAVKKRQCGTCRFFVQSDTPGFGTCTNPAWPESSAPLLLLRPNELACRTRWGTSLWQDPSDTSDPGIAAAPQQPSLPEPSSVQLQYDDEVTSVSIAGSTRGRSSLDDDVVDTSSVIPSSLAWEDELQSERRELLRQSPHDALAGARKRHMDKQARQRELIPFADDEASANNNNPVDETSLPVANVDSAPVFPADDFVEEERGTIDDVYDDELVDEGVPGVKRSPRLNSLLKSPKTGKAMTLGAASEMVVTSNNPDHREQWNSVPQIQQGFELPLSDPEPMPAPNRSLRVAASAAPSISYAPVSRPVSVAREVVTEDRKQLERAQRRIEVPLADTQPTTIENRDRLTHAPSNQAALVERLKSSPLRGYHPTPRPTQPENRPTNVVPNPMGSSPVSDASDRQPTEPVVRPVPQATKSVSSPHPRKVTATEPRVSSTQQPTKRPMIPLHVDTSPFRSTPVQIAPKVPRCCGTCTSYRASDVEGRGFCTNQYAGPVQRMVSETDLACEHTYGSMWLPADEEIWLTELPDHSGATPRVDAMIERRERRNRPILPDIEELTS